MENNYRTGEVTQLRRIADALEEILRLVKLDQEKMAKRFPDEDQE
jgi:ABC-type proline/glycine betaine transport system ATPase subunit